MNRRPSCRSARWTTTATSSNLARLPLAALPIVFPGQRRVCCSGQRWSWQSLLAVHLITSLRVARPNPPQFHRHRRRRATLEPRLVTRLSRPISVVACQPGFRVQSPRPPTPPPQTPDPSSRPQELSSSSTVRRSLSDERSGQMTAPNPISTNESTTGSFCG